MSQRILRAVPAALLMTTALSWNLANAQSMSTPADKATGAATEAVQQAPATTISTPPAAAGATSGGRSLHDNTRLPADLTPAMPAASSASASGGSQPSTVPGAVKR